MTLAGVSGGHGSPKKGEKQSIPALAQKPGIGNRPVGKLSDSCALTAEVPS
jgi:hypothetical protein